MKPPSRDGVSEATYNAQMALYEAEFAKKQAKESLKRAQKEEKVCMWLL
jgi:hypothetical protein